MIQQHLEADWLAEWAPAWRRDDPYHAPLDRVYFDHRNGELRWLPGEEGMVPDAEIRQLHADLATAPIGTYEEIPPLTHGEHHDIFRGWLQTLPQKVRDLCNNASIGGFRYDLYYHFSQEEADNFWNVPRIFIPTPPSTETQNGFAQALRKVRTDVQPYDARKTFAGWMEEAGISRSRRRQYMGHQVGDVTEIYERVELARFLEEDANRMKAYLGENMKLLKAMES